MNAFKYISILDRLMFPFKSESAASFRLALAIAAPVLKIIHVGAEEDISVSCCILQFIHRHFLAV